MLWRLWRIISAPFRGLIWLIDVVEGLPAILAALAFGRGESARTRRGRAAFFATAIVLAVAFIPWVILANT